jgi:glycosyltransferase XagB
MQTWLVHMRRPRRLIRDLGAAGTIVFQLLFAGNVISALVHPVCLLELGYALFSAPFNAPARPIAGDGAVILWAAALFCGYASSIALNMLGLRRSGLTGHAWALALTPLYWLLLSLAAWRALIDLVRDPHRWEKTEHGLARTSRLAALDEDVG